MKSGLENLQKRSKTCKCARKPKKSSNMEEIEDVLDDSGPLLYMESVLSESCEELEILMAYLSLDDDDGEC